jgi:hypothetical protein
VVRAHPNLAPGLAKRATPLKYAKPGRRADLSYSLGQIVVNGSFCQFCRFSRAHSVGHGSDMRLGRSAFPWLAQLQMASKPIKARNIL